MFTRALLANLPRRYREVPRERWDEQYASGTWDYLHSIHESSRYALLAGYCRYFGPAGAVLDAGCGEGILQRLLYPSYSRYLGIDLSAVAISRARSAAGGAAGTTFLQADVREFVPPGRFDIILFNECLYYFPQPLEVTRRYEPSLCEGGLFIISNVIRRRSRTARAQLSAAYMPLARVILTSGEGVCWEVSVLASGLRTSTGAVSPTR